MEDPSPDVDNASLRFSFLRFMGFVTITCIALVLGVKLPMLLAVWGIFWLAAMVMLLRLGTRRDVAWIVALGVCMILFAIVVWRILPNGSARAR